MQVTQRLTGNLLRLASLITVSVWATCLQVLGASSPARPGKGDPRSAAVATATRNWTGQGRSSADPVSGLPAGAQASIARAIGNDVSFSQLAVLTSTDKILYQDFGYSVAVSGDTVVVGAPAVHQHYQRNTPGAAYVFVKPPTGWQNMTQVAKLTAKDGRTGDYFGYSVAIAGNTIVVGAPNHTVNSLAGAAYVFVQPSGGWANMTQTAELTASATHPSYYLGSSVAMSGTTIVASAPGTNVGGAGIAGAAYVFVEPASGWANMTETAQLTASDAAFQAQLGNAVAIADNTIAVADEQYLAVTGAVYVFVEPAGGWVSVTQTAKLTPSDAKEAGGFAYLVATNGKVILASDPGDYPNPEFVDVFVKPKGGWVDMTAETAQLSVSGGTLADGFPSSLAIWGNVVVGGGAGTPPAAYAFIEPPGGWTNMTQSGEMQPTDGQTIGLSVAVSGKPS